MSYRQSIRLPRSRVLERGPGDAAVTLSVLPGGLRVITESVPASRSASIGVWVGVGSTDERPSLAGASHYLEHLLFKGTRRRSAADIAGAIDAVGGELNAFTAHEYTCYYAHMLAEDAAAAVDVVSDVVLNARIAASDVEVERSVILDEIAMRDDDPGDALAEGFANTMFGEHPAGDPVSGTIESVTNLSRRQVHGYYQRRYEPQSMVVAVAGGVEHRDVVRWVRDAFADRLQPGAKPTPPRSGNGLVQRRGGVRLISRDSEQAHLTVGVPGLPRHHPDRFALAVVSVALGGGMSSRLFQRIREEHGLAYSCFSGMSAYADVGAWSVYAACHPNNIAPVSELINSELRSLAADGLSADELVRTQGQLCGATVLGLEDSEARMNRIGRMLLTRGRHISIDDELTAIRAVTVEQTTAIVRRLLSQPASAAVLGPYERHRDIPRAVTALTRRPLWGDGTKR